MILGIIALAVSVVSTGLSGWAVKYVRQSAGSAAITAGHDTDRRHSELMPRFRIRVAPANPGVTTLKMRIYLLGPPELCELDGLTVSIRDDHPWRADGTRLASGPTPEQVREQIWGRWRFTPHTGPGADPVKGVPGADATGRTTPTGGLPVGEELPFFLEPTSPPPWSHQDLDSWQEQMGPYLRLRLECLRDGHKPWVLTAEISMSNDGTGWTEIPRT
jgi:hypothetical protein